MITRKPKNDCAFWGEKECRATVCTCLLTNEGAFYKAMPEHIASCEAANGRLAKLPDDVQAKIAEKYYGGVMPWKET